MRSNYSKLGNYIRVVDIKNTEEKKENLLGVSVSKVFIKSIANTVGTDFTNYRIVKKNQFTYIPDTSRRGDKIGIALLNDIEEGLVSQAYIVFEIFKTDSLLPEYLMMWFRRQEFDRYARFISHGSVREIFEWEDMCNVELPVPSVTKQKEIIKEYNVIINRIELNTQLIQKLEETAQAIYKQWFVDFEFPDKNENPYKSNGGELVESEIGEIPQGWSVECLDYFIKDSVGGDWGSSIEEGNYSKEVICIRGTDIPGFQKGQLGDSPKRYILSQNCENKALKQDQLVIEISGGSPTQSTGRTVLILDDHIKYAKLPIICSNFCKALLLKDQLYSKYIYAFINYLYKGDILFNFENSTIGLKNFDLQGFLKEQKVVLPTSEMLLKYDNLYSKILKNIFIYGRQNEAIISNQDIILSNLLLNSRE